MKRTRFWRSRNRESGSCGDAAAKLLEFEYAAVLRDRIIELKGEKA